MPLTVSFRGDGPLRSTHKPFGAARPKSNMLKQRGAESKKEANEIPEEQESYLCDFYNNIWFSAEDEPAVMARVATATGVRPTRRRRIISKQRLIDISQVAHVLTSVLDYRNDYPSYTTEVINIWAIPGEPAFLAEAADDDDRARNIVSPIQSLRDVRGPKSAPQFRGSMILEDLAGEDGGEDEAEPETEPANEDANESSANASSVGELKGTTSVQVVKVSHSAKGKKKHTSPCLASSSLDIDSAVPPPSSRNGSVIFSSVFHEKMEWSWSIRFLLGVHEPMRHALFVMDRYLEQSHRQQQVELLERHTREFFSWFKTYFVEYVQSQHEVKAKVLHPLIKIKYSTKQEILRTYDEINGLLVQIVQQERELLPQGSRLKVEKLDRSSWLLLLDTLQKSIRRLNVTLHSVLNLEEKSLHPAVASAFSETTFRDHVIPRLFHAIRAKKIVVPWIVERSRVWGGEAEQLSFQGMLPMTSRFLYKKIWRPYFMSNVAVAMKNLNEFDLASAQGRRDDIFGCVVQ